MFPSPLLLVGFMGSGKSTVGRRLAQRLGFYFADLDERIEEAAGATINDIFARQGEPAFRAVERAQLESVLREAAAGRRVVIALGGGTFAQPANLDLLRASGGVSVFLDAPIEQLLLRCAQMTNRPLFRDEVSFRALHARRLPFYQQATVTVDAGGNDPGAVVERIVARLHQLRPTDPGGTPGPEGRRPRFAG